MEFDFDFSTFNEHHPKFPPLKEEQEEIILKLLAGKHVFVNLPTSYGKTLCFIVPCLILKEVSNDFCSGGVGELRIFNASGPMHQDREWPAKFLKLKLLVQLYSVQTYTVTIC